MALPAYNATHYAVARLAAKQGLAAIAPVRGALEAVERSLVELLPLNGDTLASGQVDEGALRLLLDLKSSRLVALDAAIYTLVQARQSLAPIVDDLLQDWTPPAPNTPEMEPS
jgi:hypothetical protein